MHVHANFGIFVVFLKMGNFLNFLLNSFVFPTTCGCISQMRLARVFARVRELEEILLYHEDVVSQSSTKKL